MNRNTTREGGFTLIELMLSMTFIAIMLIAIAMCIMQMTAIYNRGETLRQVNQAARAISTDMQETFAAANPFSYSPGSIAAGRLCTGKYSYIWNTPSTNNKYASSSTELIHFVRVNDVGGTLCANLAADIIKSNATELLESGDRSLIVRSFSIDPAGEDLAIGQRLYVISVMLGTSNLDVIDAESNTCRPPVSTDPAKDSDINYCAINEFTITVRTGIR